MPTRPREGSRALVWAAIIAGLYAIAMMVLAVSCRTFFTRLDNQLALVITGVCATAMVVGALNGNDSLRLWAQVPAGLVAGLYLQPSTAGLVAIAVVVAAVRNGLSLKPRLAGFVLLAIGLVVGIGIDVGLMALTTPVDLRC
jgi:hypothetical protein